MTTRPFESILAEWEEQDRLDDLFRQRSPILWWLRVQLPLYWWAMQRAVSDAWFWLRELPFRLKHGFWRHETWSLDATIARFALPRLRYLQSHTHWFPGEVGNESAWHSTMGEIIWFLEVHTGDIGVWQLGPKDADRYERAGQLFGKYYGALWD